ncbi:MAG: SWIM zinc finger family protein [Promethearchaeota archaeon]
MDNRKREFLENRRLKKKREEPTRFKTPEEKKRIREEVEQIKRDLINFAKTTWGKQWIMSNLRVGRPFRMQRGIEYVKDKRRIDNISINSGQIFATVQGTAPTPYRVRITIETIPEKDWDLIIKNLGNKSINLIQLLEGLLSEDIIAIFENAGFSLFPNEEKGLNAKCSCPDTAIPCKHIAAVILYLARVIDYNPFLLLELVGKNKSELFAVLSFQNGDSFLDTTEKKKVSKKDNPINEFEFDVPKITAKELLKREESVINEKEISFKVGKPKKIIETVENLGTPQTINNKAFEIVFKSIYDTITSQIYEISLETEKMRKI